MQGVLRLITCRSPNLTPQAQRKHKFQGHSGGRRLWTRRAEDADYTARVRGPRAFPRERNRAGSDPKKVPPLAEGLSHDGQGMNHGTSLQYENTKVACATGKAAPQQTTVGAVPPLMVSAVARCMGRACLEPVTLILCQLWAPDRH